MIIPENNRTCEVCKKSFYRRGKRKSPTCSLVCRAEYISKVQTGKTKKRRGTYFKCKTCGKTAYCDPSRKNRTKYCSMKCRNNDKTFWMRMSGKNHYAWKGGRNKFGKGYIYVYCPEHPNVVNGKYVLEHRLIMEKKLRRYLTKKEQVHHKNGKKDDNRIENLEVVSCFSHSGKVKCTHCGKFTKVK